MNRLIYISISALLLLLTACSPKVTEAAEAQKETMAEMTDPNEFRKMAPTPGAAPKINIAEAETFQLENGLKVMLVENHKIPQVSFQLRLVNEPVREGDKVGKVAMTADIMSRGTVNRTKAEMDQAIDFIGANLSSGSNGIFATSLTKHQDKLLDLMTDVLYNPSFPEEELDKIKTQTHSGLESIKTDPNTIASNVRSRVIYGSDHPYGEIQTADHVSNISIDDLKNHYNTYYVPSNAYLIVVGDIDKAGVMQAAKKHFSKWKGGMVKPAAKRPVAMAKSRNVSFSHKEGAVQSVVLVANPVEIKPGAPDAIPASVMNTILGGGFSSRLNQNLREDKAYTYGSGSSIRPDELTGTFSASASMRNEVTDSSIVQFLYELNRIRTEPVGADELSSIKNYMTGGFARSLESPQTIARFAYNIARYNLPSDYYQNYLQRLNAVSGDDIMTMANKYLHPDKANIVVVGNKEDVLESLKQFDADGEIDYYDAFANEIKMDEVPLPDGVSAQNVIEDYVNAMGGEEKLSNIKSLYTKMSTNAMGQDLTIESFQEGDMKFAMKMGNGQMTFQEQKYDGTKAAMSMMGQSKIFTEGPEYDEMKKGARVIPQRFYMAEGITIELKGIEAVEGENCYKLAVTDGGGSVSSEFYSIASSLLARTIQSQDGPQGPVTITTDFTDYKDVGGILFPHVTTVSGMLPGGAAMEMKAEEVVVDKVFDAATFEIK